MPRTISKRMRGIKRRLGVSTFRKKRIIHTLVTSSTKNLPRLVADDLKKMEIIFERSARMQLAPHRPSPSEAGELEVEKDRAHQQMKTRMGKVAAERVMHTLNIKPVQRKKIIELLVEEWMTQTNSFIPRGVKKSSLHTTNQKMEKEIGKVRSLAAHLLFVRTIQSYMKWTNAELKNIEKRAAMKIIIEGLMR